MPHTRRTKKAPDPEIWDKRIRRMCPDHAWELISVDSSTLWCRACGQKIWRTGKPVQFPAGQIYYELIEGGKLMSDWNSGQWSIEDKPPDNIVEKWESDGGSQW